MSKKKPNSRVSISPRMNIAYLGWGSLVWNPGGLKKKICPWEADGPFLPLEFARVSKSKALTLVLFPGAQDTQTMWSHTTSNDLKKAVDSLARRERTSPENIGFVHIKQNTSRCSVAPNVIPNVVAWAKEKGLDAVVWTGLPSNFKEETGMEFNEDNAIEYISDLIGEDLDKAEEYVRNAPEQVETKVRRRLEEDFGWRSMTEYQNGFWLDKNTFIRADKAQIQMVGREKVGDSYGRTENKQMLVLTDTVEITVDKENKILGVERRPRFGLWLDAVNRALKSQRTAAAQPS